MADTRWIPGPWFVDETGDTYYIEAEPGFNHAEALNREDAHLIATAPDLYNLTEKARDLIAGDLVGSEWKRACREFIKEADEVMKKARGESNG